MLLSPLQVRDAGHHPAQRSARPRSCPGGGRQGAVPAHEPPRWGKSGAVAGPSIRTADRGHARARIQADVSSFVTPALRFADALHEIGGFEQGRRYLQRAIDTGPASSGFRIQHPAAEIHPIHRPARAPPRAGSWLRPGSCRAFGLGHRSVRRRARRRRVRRAVSSDCGTATGWALVGFLLALITHRDPGSRDAVSAAQDAPVH
jgi:hypothetical protein